jgi:hypothetical protein
VKGTYDWFYALSQESSDGSVYEFVQLGAGEELVIINSMFSLWVSDQGTLIGVYCALQDNFIESLEGYFRGCCLDRRRDGSGRGSDISHFV